MSNDQMGNSWTERISRPVPAPPPTPFSTSIRVTIGQLSGGAITYGDPIYKDPATGLWFICDASISATMPADGISLISVGGAGFPISVIFYGLLTGLVFAAGDDGKPIYVAVGGGLDVQPPPIGSGFSQQKLGFVMSTTDMMVQLDQIAVEV